MGEKSDRVHRLLNILSTGEKCDADAVNSSPIKPRLISSPSPKSCFFVTSSRNPPVQISTKLRENAMHFWCDLGLGSAFSGVTLKVCNEKKRFCSLWRIGSCPLDTSRDARYLELLIPIRILDVHYPQTKLICGSWCKGSRNPAHLGFSEVLVSLLSSIRDIVLVW